MQKEAREIVDTDFAKNIRDVINFIKAGGSFGKTQREIGRVSCGKHPDKLMQDIYKSISNSGDARLVVGIKTKGRARNAWVHADFLKENDDDEAE
jgi:hypothetical protein